MDIVIYGHGITGHATGEVFKEAGLEVGFIDPPKKEFLDYPVDTQPRACFVCVPTPAGDLSYVEDAVDHALATFKNPLIVIRSTIPPSSFDRISQRLQTATGMKGALILMPEFLRESYAVEDALKKDRCVIAGRDVKAMEGFATLLIEVGYQNVQVGTVETVEILKIALNSMLAVKVAYANIIFDLCANQKADYARLVDLMVDDGWLSRFGLQVPGRHGRGYSGTCLPKDLDWLVQCLYNRNIDGVEWLERVQEYNDGLQAVAGAPALVTKDRI